MTDAEARFWSWWMRGMAVSSIGWLALSLPISRRVIMAWTVYLRLRWHPQFRKPSARRWLWIVTMRKANGQPVDRKAH